VPAVPAAEVLGARMLKRTVDESTLAEQPACAEGRKVDKDGNEASNAFCPCSDRLYDLHGFPP
jgi:hypothetical protein